MDVEVIVKFKIKNVLDQQDIDDGFKGDLDKAVRYIIEEEGLFGVVEEDWKIIEIKKVTKK